VEHRRKNKHIIRYLRFIGKGPQPWVRLSSDHRIVMFVAMLFGLENLWQVAAIFIAAVAAGAGNAVAGGGTVLSFPILVWAGLPLVEANAVNAVGMSAGGVSASWSYRERIRRAEHSWWWLILPAVMGGGVGAWLLVALPAGWFDAVAPLFVIGAALLVAFDSVIKRHLQLATGGHRIASFGAMFLVSIYGGYFGAGIGLLVLFVLSFLGLPNLQDANAFKNLLGGAIKGVAVLFFILAGKVIWGAAIILIVGSVLGGWVAGRLAQKAEPQTLRVLVVTMGIAMGIAMAIRRYLL
jgi:uncharacterized membrane protein YfcA